MSTPSLLILPGDGIGPEVMAEVVKVIDWFGAKRDLPFEVSEDLVGGAAYDKHGTPLHDDTMARAQEVDAVLLGAVGGPKYDDLDFSLKPERGLLRLRKEMDLFANLRPAQCFDALADFSSLKRDVAAIRAALARDADAARFSRLARLIRYRAERFRRGALLREHAGLIEVDQVFARTDAIRWLERVAGHAERLSHYAAEARTHA